MGRHKSKAFVPNTFHRTVKWSYKTKSGKIKNRHTITYYIRWYDNNGKEYRRAITAENESEAKEYAKQLTQEDLISFQNTGKDSQIPYKTFGEFASIFYVEGLCPILIRKEKRNEKYANPKYVVWSHGQIMKHIVKHLGNKTFNEITKDVVQDWLDNLPSKDKIRHNTANKMLVFLNDIFKEAKKQFLVKENPCNGVERLIPDTKKRHSFTKEQIATLFRTPWKDDMAYTACLAFAGSGARMSEVLAIKPSKLLVETNEILFDKSYSTSGEKQTKNNTAETSPIPPAIMAKLVAYAKGKDKEDYLFSYNGTTPIKREELYSALYSELETRGIDRFCINGREIDKEKELPLSFHSFRTTINTVLLEAGVPEHQVRKVLRQKSPTVTQYYTDRENIDVTKAKEALDNITIVPKS